MYLYREQLNNLKAICAPNKAVVIYGPRRCGKTRLIKKFLEGLEEKYLFVSGEDIHNQQYLSSQSIEKLKNFVGEHKWLLIDEAQKVKNIGLNLKLILDHIEGIRVIATGSSAFDLAHEIGEPLTGRKFTLRLYPLAQMEIGKTETPAETDANLESRLIYGGYPEVVTARDDGQKQQYLKELVNAYLFKDILELEGLRYSDKLVRLLQLLAFQIGKEVSLQELGGQLGMSKNTVERYLELLEKAFVILRVGGFSRNLRKEISKASRYYFYDTGIRNALINNFNRLDIRDDKGLLWENYVILERIKKQEYQKILLNRYFWRTYSQKEIDWVEEREGMLHGYEIKWDLRKSIKEPAEWKKMYPKATYEVLDRNHYLAFIT